MKVNLWHFLVLLHYYTLPGALEFVVLCFKWNSGIILFLYEFQKNVQRQQ